MNAELAERAADRPAPQEVHARKGQALLQHAKWYICPPHLLLTDPDQPAVLVDPRPVQVVQADAVDAPVKGQHELPSFRGRRHGTFGSKADERLHEDAAGEVVCGVMTERSRAGDDRSGDEGG